MDFPLTIPTILRRAESMFGHKQVVTRLPDRSIVRRPYAQVIDRAKRLAVALTELGVRPGDRVATLGWNTQQHLEAYLAIPSAGAVLHTLNLRLHCDDLSYIVNDADDQVLLLGASTLVPKTEIPGTGWFAIFTDPTGNRMALYTPAGDM